MAEGVTGSAVNELEVSEREYESRLRAIKNLEKMKKIESTWLRVGVCILRGGILTTFKPNKNGKTVRI